MGKQVSSEQKPLQFFNLLYLFLIIIEAVNLTYSYIIGVGNINNFILLAIFITLKIVYETNKNKNTFRIKFYTYITILILFLYLILNFIFNIKIFFAGTFLVEVSIVLIFSNIRLIEKLAINLVFGAMIIFAYLFLDFFSLIISEDIISFTALFTANTIVIIISDRVLKSYLEVLYQSEKKSLLIFDSNKFLKTILNQEEIKVLYYFPEEGNAIFLSTNYNSKLDEDIPNLLTYIREKDLIPLEYFGMIQNAINIVLKQGFSSIILPVTRANTKVWLKMNGIKAVDETSKKVKIIISITNVNDLKTVELKFKNALNQCDISIWEYDIQKDLILNYSDTILEYYFYGKNIDDACETLLNRNIVYYSDIDILKDGFSRVKQGDSEVSFEIRIYPSRNSYFTWVRLNFTCFKDSFGKPTNAWVSIENIDDAKASEKWFEIERKKSFDNKSGLILMAEVNISRDFITSFNSNVSQDLSALANNSIKSLIDAFLSLGKLLNDDGEIYERLSQKSLLAKYERGERVLEYEYKVLTNTDDILYISNVIKLFLDLKTKEIIAFAFLYDITQNSVTKLSIDSILKSKFVYLANVNILNSHMAIDRTQLQDVTNAANSNRIYKDEWDVFIEKYVHEDDKEYVAHSVSIENIREQIKYRKTFSFDYRISDHGNMLGMRRCHFIKTEADSPFIIILEENVIDELIGRIQNELVLKAALNQATQAASAKSQFLSRMSHEIRTPLSAIIGLSELGRNNKLVESDDYFNKIYDSGQYLLGLVNDILDMNKLELGNIKLNPEVIDTLSFYDMILSIIKDSADKKNINFVFNQLGPCYRYQYLEKLRVQQILLNVLNNAIKYTNINGVVDYTITNAKINGKLFAIHVVKDNGVGISKEFMNKIFNPFTREKNSLSDTEGGTGLGLAICSNLVKQLEGEIKVSSQLNVGTTITITLPLIKASESEYSKVPKVTKSLSDNKAFIGKKILIAEDHQVNAMIIQTILKNNGIDTIVVENGLQAVETFANSKLNEFDMILMDIMMPKLNGLDATKEIRALDRVDAKSIAIIALSANAFDEDKTRSLEYGMNDHLKKPIEIKILLETLNKFL